MAQSNPGAVHMQGSNKERDELSRKRRLSASIPVSHQDLRDLFDPPDRQDAPPCDHALQEHSV